MSQITVLTTAATFISQSAHSSVFITRCTKQTRKDLPHFSHICLFISVGFLSLQSIFLPPIQHIFSIDFTKFSPIFQLTSPNSVHFFYGLQFFHFCIGHFSVVMFHTSLHHYVTRYLYFFTSHTVSFRSFPFSSKYTGKNHKQLSCPTF